MISSPSICDSSLRGLRCVNGDVHVAYYNDATLCKDPTSIDVSSFFSFNYNNMCKPLNDPGYYTAYNGSDTIYTDVAMQEPNVLKEVYIGTQNRVSYM